MLRYSRRQQSGIAAWITLLCVWGAVYPDRIGLPVSEGYTSLMESPDLMLLDINHADSLTLQALPGIGPVLAARIIKYRNRIGCFDSTAQLLEIYGITPHRLDQFRPFLFVGECSRKPPRFRSGAYKSGSGKWLNAERKIIRPSEKINLNLTDSAGLIQFDIVPDWLSVKLVKERDRIGCFTGWVQISRIQGMLPAHFDSLQTWTFLGPCKNVEEKTVIPVPEKTIIRVCLNTAAESELLRIPGMRKSLAKKILRYREALGFYHDFSQLEEIKDAPDPDVWAGIEPYLYISEINTLPDSVYLFINQFNMQELAKHPYVGYSLARRIVNYREEHGRFVSMKSLSKIYGVKPEIWEKLKDYIRFE